MDQIERITRMENFLNEGEKAVSALDRALDGWEAVQGGLAELEAYYGSEAWRQDYADDEAGKIPRDLPRGVLSEDAVYNLLADWDRLRARMAELGEG